LAATSGDGVLLLGGGIVPLIVQVFLIGPRRAAFNRGLKCNPHHYRSGGGRHHYTAAAAAGDPACSDVGLDAANAHETLARARRVEFVVAASPRATGMRSPRVSGMGRAMNGLGMVAVRSVTGVVPVPGWASSGMVASVVFAVPPLVHERAFGR
jgi:hypothetical protein